MSARLILGRLAAGVLALLAAIVLLDVASDWLGDPVARQLGPEADATARSTLRAALGLDTPFGDRLAGSLGALARGDLGVSVWLRQPAGGAVAQALPVTLGLAALAWPMGLAGGIGLGIALSNAPATWSRLPLAVLSVPSFVAAIVAVEVFATGLGWAPAAGFDGVRSLALPAALLASGIALKLGLLLQERLRAIKGQDFVLFAASRGLPRRRQWLAYRLLPAASLVARFGALHAGYLLGGALVIETVFALPGLGRLAVLALINRDLVLLRAAMLTAGAGFLMARLVSETAQAWLDPRPGTVAA